MTSEPLRRAPSMSPSRTTLRHSQSAVDVSRRRFRVMSAHFGEPGTFRIRSFPLSVDSLYSMTLVSESMPEASLN